MFEPQHGSSSEEIDTLIPLFKLSVLDGKECGWFANTSIVYLACLFVTREQSYGLLWNILEEDQL